MFLQKAALQHSSVELAVSYMEIYKDEVYDLFVNRESVRCLNFTVTLDNAICAHFRDIFTRYRHPSFLSVKTMSVKYLLPT